jgi:hypothetical protein
VVEVEVHLFMEQRELAVVLAVVLEDVTTLVRQGVVALPTGAVEVVVTV